MSITIEDMINYVLKALELRGSDSISFDYGYIVGTLEVIDINYVDDTLTLDGEPTIIIPGTDIKEINMGFNKDEELFVEIQTIRGVLMLYPV